MFGEGEDEDLDRKRQEQSQGWSCVKQEIGLEDYMNQLDLDHDEYLKEDQVADLDPEREIQAETVH